MTKVFKPKTQLSKFFLKIKNRSEYQHYKHYLNEHKKTNIREEVQNAFRSNYGVLNLDKIILLSEQQGFLNLSHSGNAGDIIYALPTIRAIYNHVKVPLNLYLVLEQKHRLTSYYDHPLGSVMLNQKMATMLQPLLSSLAYLNEVYIYENQKINIKLDSFRDLGLNLDRGNIVRWYNYAIGVNPDLSEPWLSIKSNAQYADSVLIARSERYRNPHITYSFLDKYKNLIFIGVESEFLDIRKYIPHIQWKQVDDFKEMAEIIAGCKFFIGNQSFPFAVAEALRIPRILETGYDAPNVIPEGNMGFDFYLQEHFEWLVDRLYQR